MNSDLGSCQDDSQDDKQSSLKQEPMLRFEYTSIVKITVGPQKKAFYVHKEPLCGKSDFFKAACCGTFQESSGTIDLPDQNPATVNYFIHWTCTSQLRGLYSSSDTTRTTITSLKKAAEHERQQAASAEQQRRYGYSSSVAEVGTEKRAALDTANYQELQIQRLIDLYIFGDFAQVIGLKDAIVDAVIEAYGNPDAAERNKTVCFWGLHKARQQWLVDPVEMINSAWDRLPADCHFRLVLVNLFCDAVSETSGTRYATEFCPSFLAAAFDLTMTRAKTGVKAGSWLRPELICNYHCHDAPCSKQ
ncbi:MAG: hypothetical protein Q9213_004244 [Squamulea squamosa]